MFDRGVARAAATWPAEPLDVLMRREVEVAPGL